MSGLRRTVTLLILTSLLAVPIGATPIVQQIQPRAAGESLTAELRIAASQHAIIQVLLDEGQWDAVPEEFQRIVGLKLSGPHENLVVRSAWQIADRLMDAGQYKPAHEIVAQTLGAVEQVDNQFSLLMLKAKIFQAQKLYPQAIQTAREAQRLQPPSSQKPF